eukprot:4539103-Prymnesium_polylepis.1
MAAQIAGASSVPIISPSATTPLLSDGLAYPYFLRDIPSDSFTAVAMVKILGSLWNYSNVALVYSTDAYGAGGADAFERTSSESGISLLTIQRFARDTDDFWMQQTALQQSGARVVVMFCDTRDGSRFLRSAFNAGIGGQGY